MLKIHSPCESRRKGTSEQVINLVRLGAGADETPRGTKEKREARASSAWPPGLSVRKPLEDWPAHAAKHCTDVTKDVCVRVHLFVCPCHCLSSRLPARPPACTFACMSVECMHSCVHVCMYVCMYMYCMYVYVCVCMSCMYVYVCVCICMYMYVYVCVCICICICMYMYVYVSMYLYVYVCICM